MRFLSKTPGLGGSYGDSAETFFVQEILPDGSVLPLSGRFMLGETVGKNPGNSHGLAGGKGTLAGKQDAINRNSNKHGAAGQPALESMAGNKIGSAQFYGNKGAQNTQLSLAASQFCHFVMKKSNWTTAAAFHEIAGKLHMSQNRFNAAGNKDRNATTVQLA
ncbi:MAG TPA: tRNA pseudouridine(13) synthase TruD, partial [Candidatus Micrarchaeota archaeon]|nr:tRNA pseudouridine(13) synthase TruD [Candidatus Micrarchaeota archaeon]